MKELLDELQTLGPEEQRLAALLLGLAQSYDVESMRTLLEEIPHD